MRRPHRRWHRRIWLVLPVLLFVGIGAALVLRPPPLIEPSSGVGR
jgi:hypothetical protein